MTDKQIQEAAEKWYPVEYAGTWYIQLGGMYNDKSVLDAEDVGYEKAKLNAESICEQHNQIQSQSQWIPVSERLPELEQRVMSYSKDGYERLTKYTTYSENSYGYKQGLRDRWFESIELNSCLHHENVTHWRPRPEPPKVETK